MKTKNKIVAFVGIAIVLCSVFLVALPAIAADQNQGMQKVSSTEVTTASEDDYVLDIYGNANEDDTIDMRDLTYVKLIFFGKKPETELADAKYDGKLNPLDFIQIKLIIVGKDKELTVVDAADRIVTISKPVETIIPDGGGSAQAARTLKVQDKVVGVSIYTKWTEVFFPEFSKLPAIGSTCVGHAELDYEKLFELNPGILFASPNPWPDLEEKIEPTDITMICVDLYTQDVLIKEMKKMGYILNKKDEAREFINFYEGSLNPIKEETEKLSEENKPRVYVEVNVDYLTASKGTFWDYMITTAGGINLAAYLEGEAPWFDYPVVDPEWVAWQNPDMIIRDDYLSSNGYEEDDPAEIKEATGDVLSRTGLEGVTAIKERKVYLVSCSFAESTTQFVVTAYLAKLFHPTLFEDLDPEAIHQEYLTEFQGLDYDLDEHGIFVYPPIEIDDGLAGIPDKWL